METLFQLGIGLISICAFAFLGGIVMLIASKGKSKPALKVVLISAITAFAVVAIGFSICVYEITR